MPVDINTWSVVIGLFVNTTQQSAVFHLTKCRDFTLYSVIISSVIDSIQGVF